MTGKGQNNNHEDRASLELLTIFAADYDQECNVAEHRKLVEPKCGITADVLAIDMHTNRSCAASGLHPSASPLWVLPCEQTRVTTCGAPTMNSSVLAPLQVVFVVHSKPTNAHQ